VHKRFALSLSAAAVLCANAAGDVIDITVPGTTLQQVIGNQFLVGNHLFTLDAGAFTSTAFTASQIFITPVINADPLTGAGFRLSGAFGDPPGGTSSTFTLQYIVDLTIAAQTTGYRFDRADLRFNGSSSGAGAISRVTENLSNSSEGGLGTLTVSNNVGSPPVFQDQTTFASNSLTRLLVTDNGEFNSGEIGTSSASFMDFSFGDRLIPTPGVLTVLAGAAGLALRRRR
jgi:hypothetical protein